MCQLDIFNLTICQLSVGDLTAVFQEPERPTKIMNAHIEKAGLDDLQIVKALGAGGFGLVKLVKVKGQRPSADRQRGLKNELFCKKMI